MAMKQGKVGKPSLKNVVGEGESSVIDMGVANEMFVMSTDIPHDGPSRHAAPAHAKAKTDDPSKPIGSMCPRK